MTADSSESEEEVSKQNQKQSNSAFGNYQLNLGNDVEVTEEKVTKSNNNAVNTANMYPDSDSDEELSYISKVNPHGSLNDNNPSNTTTNTNQTTSINLDF